MQSKQETAALFKALADESRLQIVDLLSCQELYGCHILRSMHIRQPTLSYHLKILTDNNIVYSRREGAWIRYFLNQEQLKNLKDYLEILLAVSLTSST